MKKKVIEIASACATVLGMFLAYLEVSEHEEHLASIENRLADMERAAEND